MSANSGYNAYYYDDLYDCSHFYGCCSRYCWYCRGCADKNHSHRAEKNVIEVYLLPRSVPLQRILLPKILNLEPFGKKSHRPTPF